MPDDPPDSNPICGRLRDLRIETFGKRGRSAFSRVLGIRPSTYQAYERDRTPPAELLAKACDATGADLVWLITGRGEMRPGPKDDPTVAVTADGAKDVVPMIPLVGSTAAGPARFWPDDAGAGPSADGMLERRVSRAVDGSRRDGFVAEGGAAALVALDAPTAEGVWEFLDAPDVAARHPRAVAWRIDGDSMAPRFRDGDLIVTAPGRDVLDGQACVARQLGQVGVNCKILRREGDEIWLVPVNEAVSAQRVAAADLVWTQPVVASVRF
ncbi:MAG: S24 family peptidase [Planctomycetota bacterium]